LSYTPPGEALRPIFSTSTTRKLCSRSCRNARKSSYVAEMVKESDTEPTASPEEPIERELRATLESEIVPRDTPLRVRPWRGATLFMSMTRRILSTLDRKSV